MRVIGMTEVLLARIADRGAAAAMSAKSLCLSSIRSGAASMTMPAPATAPSSEARRCSLVEDRAGLLAHLLQVAGDVPGRLPQHVSVRVAQGRLVAGRREHLGDAAPHEAGADDGHLDFPLRACLQCRVPPVRFRPNSGRMVASHATRVGGAR